MAKILLGVCGGISAYKSCELVREFQRRGHEVRVLMTDAAQKFVTRMTFEALTHAPIPGDLFGDGAFGTAHIDWARWPDAMVVAPATAHTLAKFAHGRADDFLSTAYLAFRGPLFLAPAMNTVMWEHPAVRANVELLRERGARFIDPVPGELACGEVGVGKMAEPLTIAIEVLRVLEPPSLLKGKRVLVTAGPTHEYLDPVRFISSPSSGKMGFAIAREAARRGAIVTVVHGPVSVPSNFQAQFLPVTSAAEMAAAVDALEPPDIGVAAAAVADFTPARPAESKTKRQASGRVVEFVPTPDILKQMVSRRKKGDFIVGFAAETDHVVENAKLKLESKGVDLIVANEVFRSERGFGVDETSVTIFGRRGVVATFERTSKAQLAGQFWDIVETEFTREDRQTSR